MSTGQDRVWDYKDLAGSPDFGGETTGVSHDGVLRTTDRAVLLDMDGEEVWLPKAVICEIDGEGVVVQQWFAKTRGWE